MEPSQTPTDRSNTSVHSNKGPVVVPAPKGLCEQHPSFDLNIKTPSKWTILMDANDGFYDFVMNWYIFYEKLKMNDVNLVFLCEDDRIHQKLSKQTFNKRVSIIRTNAHSISAQAHDFNSPEYNKFVTTRPSNLISVICSISGQTENLIYADADLVWKKNPIPYLEQHMYGKSKKGEAKKPTADIVMQRDSDNDDNLCTGFMGMKMSKSESLTKFLATWETELTANRTKAVRNQRVFNENLLQRGVHTNLGLKVEGLPLELFPSGQFYFDKFNNKKRKEVVVVHNNYIVGKHNKTERFKEFGLWKYKESGNVLTS